MSRVGDVHAQQHVKMAAGNLDTGCSVYTIDVTGGVSDRPQLTQQQLHQPLPVMVGGGGIGGPPAAVGQPQQPPIMSVSGDMGAVGQHLPQTPYNQQMAASGQPIFGGGKLSDQLTLHVPQQMSQQQPQQQLPPPVAPPGQPDESGNLDYIAKQ